MNGAERLCHALRELDVSCVFGLPGTQNVRLYEALRSCGLRRVVSSDEGAAAFMATGYARASGKVGVLTTIPGPGFVYALPGVVEARHDSVALLWITLRQRDSGRAFQLQRIDQAVMAGPAVKCCIHVTSADDIGRCTREAFEAALGGEPGPVLVEIDADLLEQVARGVSGLPSPAPRPAGAGAVEAALRSSRRPLIFAGQGAQGASAAVRQLARQWRAPVLCTSSGRGVLADADELSFVQDFSTGLGIVPEMIEHADLVLALGCKFTHNGSAGGRLLLPESKLVRVDASREVLAANYPARVTLEARVEDFLAALDPRAVAPSDWSDDLLASWRERVHSDNAAPIPMEPVLPDTTTGSLRAWFAALAAAAGDDVIYTADAGLHQALTRRYAVVMRPRGLLCPSDFQSMGFGLPGAIGAALAQPATRVIACVGDAGILLTLGELATAVRERVDLAVVVFNDGQMSLIRRQQLVDYGHESGVSVASLDLEQLAAAIGCSYFPVRGDVEQVAKECMQSRGVRLVELRLADSPSLDWQRRRSVLREAVGALVPVGARRSLKRLLGR